MNAKRILSITLVLLSVCLFFNRPTLCHAQSETTAAAESKPQSDLIDWRQARGNANSTGAFPKSIGDSFEIDWEVKYPKGAFESSPIIVHVDGKSTVYVAGLNVNVKGHLYAIDLESGEVKWTFEIEEGFVSPPAWRDGRIYLGDMAGMIYCVDEDGKQIWQYETQGEISSSPNFYESLVLVGSQDATLYALDQKTGELKWSHAIDDQIQCGATIAGDRCFLAGCDAKLHIIDLKTGKEVDSVEIGSPTGTTAAVLGEAAYFGTEEGSFFSIDYTDAKALWRYQDPKGATSIRSSAAVTPKHVVFGARNRKVTALNPKTGSEIWSTTLKAKIDGSPIIAGDRVHIGSTDGRLYTLDIADGKILWQKEFGGSFMGAPAIIGGETPRLVVATERGVVYCLKKTQ